MPSSAPTGDLLAPRRLLTLTAWFIAAVLCLHGLSLLAVRLSLTPLGISRYFPVSYFHPRLPDLPQTGIALLSIAMLIGAQEWLRRVSKRHRPLLVALIGLLTILTTTAIQGIDRGFVYPVAGREPHVGGQQYWHDAEERHLVTPSNTAAFLRRFSVIQPALHEHARTHPPGAVLFLALLHAATGGHPIPAALLIAALAVALTAVALHLMPGIPPGFGFLVFLLPAVQIYYCATLDAVVTGLLLVAIAAHTRGIGPPAPHPQAGGYPFMGGGGRGTNSPCVGHILITALSLIAVSFLTFGWVWVVPVLLIAEIAPELGKGRSVIPWRTALVLFPLLLIYGALFLAFRFDYVAAFRLASHLENPHGFRLIADPASYCATRIEDIAEIALFCGPFLLWLIPKGLPILRREQPLLFAVCLAAVGTLLALFLTGAFRTGETARACLFVFPFLLLPALAAPLSERDRETLCRLVFVQSVLMQCFGFWFW